MPRQPGNDRQAGRAPFSPGSRPVPGPHPQYRDIRLALLGPGPAPRAAREVPGPFPAYPSADGLMFTCRSCGGRSEMRVDGGTAKAGEEMTLACERRCCAAVNRVTVRRGMFS